MNLRRIATQSALVLGAVLLSAGIQTFAFTDTNATPPSDDAYAPLTTSNVPEFKEAGLTINRGGAPVGLVVNGAVKINNSTIPCDGTTSGALRSNAGNLQNCNGSEWRDINPDARTYPIYKDTVIPIIPAIDVPLPDIGAGRNGQWNCVTVYNNTSLGGVTFAAQTDVALKMHGNTPGAPRGGNQARLNIYLNGAQVYQTGNHHPGGRGFWPWDENGQVTFMANTPYNSLRVDMCTVLGSNSMAEGGHPAYFRMDAVSARHRAGYDLY